RVESVRRMNQLRTPNGRTCGRWIVVAMVYWIDPAHRFLEILFFDYVRDESGSARNHKNTIERRGIHSEIGEDRADRPVHVDRKYLFRLSECLLNRARGLHVRAIQAGLARQLEQTRCARVLGVKPMTKSRHAFTCLATGRECTRCRIIR